MKLIRVAVVVMLATVAVIVLLDRSAVAGPGECVETDPYGFCIEWDVEAPETPGSPGSGGAEPVCFWETLDYDMGENDPTIWVDFGLDYPPTGVDIVWQSWECSDGRTTFDFRWVVAPTPGNLATIARGRLVGTLPQPVVDSSPVAGVPSIVGVPVFVAVSNWTGTVSESECAGGLCVTVTATPALTFSPGEPGAANVACAGSGSRFSRDAGSAEAQASAPGACAHSYRLRTGAAGRPSSWPGEVSVTWSIAWTATSGAAGTLPPITRSTSVPRPVSEVQTVIRGGATP